MVGYLVLGSGCAVTLARRAINPATLGLTEASHTAVARHRCRSRVREGTQEVVPVDGSEDMAAGRAELEELREHVRALEEEVLKLRRRLQDAPKRVRTLEERLLETKGQLAQAVSQNEKLTYTLREAREHIAALREEVDKLTQPPSAYGTLLGHNEDGTVDVFTGGRKVRVAIHPELA